MPGALTTAGFDAFTKAPPFQTIVPVFNVEFAIAVKVDVKFVQSSV